MVEMAAAICARALTTRVSISEGYCIGSARRAFSRPRGERVTSTGQESGRKEPVPSGRGSERTPLWGVEALRSFMGNNVAEDAATRSSMQLLYLPLALRTTCT